MVQKILWSQLMFNHTRTPLIGIVGHGFVGKAVDYGFSQRDVKKFIVDPNIDTTIDDLTKFDPDVTFVAVPTPMSDDGKIDASIVTKVVKELIDKTKGFVVVKSTVTPDIMMELANLARDRIVYNPEFLTEKNANEDFINPKMHVFGGDPGTCRFIEELFETCSLCRPCPVFHVSIAEASLIKYGINSFLATKVLWFNQFYDTVNGHGNYNRIISAIANDPRIGHSHTIVPGFDGKRGFGGACFPKDTKALSYFDPEFSILKDVITANNKIRSTYEKDSREKEQNVNYD
jgi:UDPglucose 6-dehydrogenase